MKRRRWDSKTKAMVILQGIKGTPVSEICNEHQISQSEYYRWREIFLSKMAQVFDNTDKRLEGLQQENTRLKTIIGDLSLELKKSNECLE